MASTNKMVVLGHLGGDAILRYTTNGTPVANVSVATNEKINGKDLVEWHRWVLWGELAEAAGKLWKKGKQVYLEGRKRSRPYTKDGVDHVAVEFHATNGFMTGPAPIVNQQPPVESYEGLVPMSSAEMRAMETMGEALANDIPF